MQRSAKERKSKPSFCLGATVTIRVTANALDPPPPETMKITHGKDLMVIQECPHEV